MKKSYVVAEIAQTHDGSLGLAHAFIDAAARRGVDAVKFQTHFASFESTLDEPFRVKFSRQDESRYAYWKRMEFSPDQWKGLAQHAKDLGIDFLSSAFSLEAVKVLEDLNMPAWKIGSGEFKNFEMLEMMGKTGKPIWLSTGMCSLEEVDSTVSFLKKNNYKFAVFQCTTMYPTPLTSVGMNLVDVYRERFACPVGLSDHSGTIFPALLALAKGVDVIEVHVTFDREMFGPDVSSSVTFDELETICKARDSFFQIENNPVDKDTLAKDFATTKHIFGKSLALVMNRPSGHVITRADISQKKPGTGILIDEIHKVVGRKLKRDVTSDRLLKWEDLE